MSKINLNTVIRIFEFSWLTSLSNFYKQCTLRCLYVHTGTYSPASHSLVLYNRKWVVRWNAAVFSSPHYTERERGRQTDRERERKGAGPLDRSWSTLWATHSHSHTQISDSSAGLCTGQYAAVTAKSRDLEHVCLAYSELTRRDISEGGVHLIRWLCHSRSRLACRGWVIKVQLHGTLT